MHALARHELSHLAHDRTAVLFGDRVLAVRLHPRLKTVQEGVQVEGEFFEARALLVGEVVDDADPRAARALGAALRALVVRPVVREALGRDRLAREARRAKAL